MTLDPALTVCIGPMLLFSLALISSARADRHPGRMLRMAEASAWLTLVLSVGVAVRICLLGSVHQRLGPIAIRLDVLTAVMLLLVSFLGAVVIRFSRNYLAGEPGQGSFVKWLGLCIGCVLTLVLAGNFPLLLAGWMGTSLALHRLLVFYRERPTARIAARKKFVFSRISDLCLIAAAVLLWQRDGTLDFEALFIAARASGDGLQVASLLLVASAVLKSAQFPFHCWLPETMETPTPVSALMHAGIVNAGGFLIVRLSPLLVHSSMALLLLASIGTITAIFASLVMLTQTSVKKSLAYSTIAQMGFMMLQCGLGAFPLAVLHIVAHSLYKARAFLGSGSAIVDSEKLRPLSGGGDASPFRPVLALLFSALLIGGFLRVFPDSGPAVVILGAILVMGLATLLSTARSVGIALRCLLLAALIAVAFLLLHHAADAIFSGSLAETALQHGPGGVVVLGSILVVFAAALLFQALLPRLHSRAWCRALYVHLHNGLYVNTLVSRLILRLWPFHPKASTHTQP
jgi:NAD(P)H-quinone oxidoreductase subunit 5